MLSTTDADLSTSAMSYFGQGWEPARAPQRRWQESGAEQDDEDEEYGGMDHGARGRGGREQGRDRGYRPLSAGYRGGGGGFAERQRQEQEQGLAWDHGQDTREGWARGRQERMGPRGEPQLGGRGGGGPRSAFEEGRHADPMRRGGMMQQPPMQGAGDAMSEMRRRRMAQEGRSQQEPQRPKGKARKGSQRQAGQGHGLQESKYGYKTERQEAFEPRKTEGRRYERGGASDRGRHAWGRDSVYEPTCEPAGGTDGRGAAQGGHPEYGSGDEDELLAAEMAKVKKLEARIEARMQQRQQEQDKRAGTKLPGGMDEDDDDDREGGGAVAAKSAEVAFDEDDDAASSEAEAEARAAAAPRRRRSASPAPAEGRLGPEPAWSERCLFRLDAAQQRRLGMQAEVTFNEMAPSNRKADMWPGATVLSDVAAAAQRSTGSRFASVPWAKGELAQRGMVMLRATIDTLDEGRATNTRVIDEQWVTEARNELMAMAPWLMGLSVYDDARWATLQQPAERGATCSEEKLAKRVIWVECALRMMLVAGVDTDEGWDEAMQLTLEEKPNADEDLSDPSQLAAVASETLSNAHRYFTGGPTQRRHGRMPRARRRRGSTYGGVGTAWQKRERKECSLRARRLMGAWRSVRRMDTA